jgi:hypothetical protein
VPFCSVQGVVPGQTVYPGVTGPAGLWTPVIRQVTFYFGAPSGVLSNSVVILDNHAQVGVPTVVAYDSGIDGSDNPIYEHFELNLVLAALELSDEPNYWLRVVNTSDSAANVDVAIAGFLLEGSSEASFDVYDE